MDKWQKIWNKNERVNDIILEGLMKADGFDSGAGSFTVDSWKQYIKEAYIKLGIKSNDSVFDIGCGSGAFIYPLYLENHRVGGIDYSEILIDLANTIFKSSDFRNDEAIHVNEETNYDYVVSHSVFQYFKDLNYAKKVIEKMIIKADNKIGIFDVNDKAKEDSYHQLRMGSMDKNEYEEKYKDLEHMFYDKSWFKKIAEEYGLHIYIYDQTFEKYANSQLRFNVIMEKK